ncbi:Multiple epidermal growth factor-like domains protein 6 [Chionoecetes opilio]|uniref:Multiple epidermal growth factor-like domains protein 6 n=1 Tax=Chionoecetes opilio TaxID=41210 RepID=A0A8J4XLH7_CHIOP|nr:Multiple epidermal growth factor-like domains protein 6 [Chionoecetes opilio]
MDARAAADVVQAAPTNGVIRSSGSSGECECQPGYVGATCSEECPEGLWGPACANECQCVDGAPCHPSTGTCLHHCPAGLTGDDCDTPCSKGQHGQGCLQTCSCEGEGACDPVTGECLCPAGRKGPQCLQCEWWWWWLHSDGTAVVALTRWHSGMQN